MEPPLLSPLKASTFAEDISSQKGYFSPGLLFQLNGADSKMGITLALIDKFAAKVLEGKERQYLIFPASMTEGTVFKVFYTDRPPLVIYQGEKPAWYIYREITAPKWHMQKETFLSLTSCLEKITASYTPYEHQVNP